MAPRNWSKSESNQVTWLASIQSLTQDLPLDLPLDRAFADVRPLCRAHRRDLDVVVLDA